MPLDSRGAGIVQGLLLHALTQARGKGHKGAEQGMAVGLIGGQAWKELQQGCERLHVDLVQ